MENTEQMSIEDLQRKEDQAWEMAGLASQDHDSIAVARHTKEARTYRNEIKRRYTMESVQ